MSGVRPVLTTEGPNTYEVSAPVKGGQLVAPTVGGKVGPATAGSTLVLGVSHIDARPYVNPVSVDADGFDTINIAPLPPHASVGFGRFEVTYAADAAFGQALKAGANGTVTPWVSGTDAADLIVGYCDEPKGVVVATKAKGLANISR